MWLSISVYKPVVPVIKLNFCVVRASVISSRVASEVKCSHIFSWSFSSFLSFIFWYVRCLAVFGSYTSSGVLTSQGWFIISLMHILSQGSRRRILSIRLWIIGKRGNRTVITHSLHSDETFAIRSYLQSIIIVKVSESLAWANGASPDTSLYNITPRDQTSELKL